MIKAGSTRNTVGFSALVVDDDIDMARLIEALLRDMGAMSVDRAKNGKQGIGKLRKHINKYDLIVSNWEMPEVNGLELLLEVRKYRPDLPFLMLTVRSNSDEILAAKNAGVTAYISKPFTPHDLQKKILTVMRQDVATQEFFLIC
jgi:two-component system chemotaxis response regulator CheY